MLHWQYLYGNCSRDYTLNKPIAVQIIHPIWKLQCRLHIEYDNFSAAYILNMTILVQIMHWIWQLKCRLHTDKSQQYIDLWECPQLGNYGGVTLAYICGFIPETWRLFVPCSSVQTLATGVVQLFLADQGDRNRWSKRCCGVACFVKDNSKRSFYIRIYDIKVINTMFVWFVFCLC